ncbi:Uncharacterised protein [Vibrio cholerae]|nr:Uncharacterised protein [Vibrio cholerae]
MILRVFSASSLASSNLSKRSPMSTISAEALATSVPPPIATEI